MELYNEDGNAITDPKDGDIGYMDREGGGKHYYHDGQWHSENRIWMFT